MHASVQRFVVHRDGEQVAIPIEKLDLLTKDPSGSVCGRCGNQCHLAGRVAFHSDSEANGGHRRGEVRAPIAPSTQPTGIDPVLPPKLEPQLACEKVPQHNWRMEINLANATLPSLMVYKAVPGRASLP
eukprot:scaffold12594_cov129-Isochrysis_galbana.AAC.2